MVNAMENKKCEYCGQFHRPLKQSKENLRAVKRRLAKEAKHDCLVAYGGNPPKCNCCGESQEDFLTLDHINNDGTKQKEEKGYSNIMFYLRKRGFPYKEELRVLCFNCNMGRRVAGGICPHKKDKLIKS